MDELILKRNINSILSQVTLKSINNDDEYRIAGEWLKRIKETEKMVDNYFEPLKKEAYKTYKTVLGKIKEVKEPLMKLETVIKNMRIKYKQEKERRLREEKERLLKLVDDKDKGELDKIIDDKIEEDEGITHIEIWDFKIVDESKLPREYLIPDEKKIRQVVKAMGDKAKIPGVEVYKRIVEKVRV